ncbi:uncharacterized protein LOC141914893 [Tubulanus polymorphus]|uniref:uncharacterized protein LOC141914893 n=1 Tax=Tubulanus polymorphus TaxID=672921 RepID=UPI003DA44EF9
MEGSNHFHDRDPVTGRCHQCDKRKIRGYEAEHARKLGKPLPPSKAGTKDWKTYFHTLEAANEMDRRRKKPSKQPERPAMPSRSSSISNLRTESQFIEPDYEGTDRRASSPNAQAASPIYIQIGQPSPSKSEPPPNPPPPTVVVQKTPTPPPPPTPVQPQPQVIIVEKEVRKPSPPPASPIPQKSPDVLVVEVPRERPRSAPTRKMKSKPKPQKPEVLIVERPRSARPMTPTTIRADNSQSVTRTNTVRTVSSSKRNVLVKNRPVRGQLYSTRNSRYLEYDGRRRCCCCCITSLILGLLLAGLIAGLVYWKLGLDFVQSIPTPRNWWVVDDYSGCKLDPVTNTTAAGCVKTTIVMAPNNFSAPPRPTPSSGVSLLDNSHCMMISVCAIVLWCLLVRFQLA